MAVRWRRRCRRPDVRALLALAALSLWVAVAQSAPRRPTSADEILVRLPGGAQLQTLEGMRQRLTATPGDLTAAHELASGYVDLGRSQDDPRLVAYALTTLAPSIGPGSTSAISLLIAADASQYLHQFDQALDYLDRSLAVDPANARALLMRANLLEVRGDLAGARAACARLGTIAAQEITIACLSSVQSRSGQLEQSFHNLQSMYAAAMRLPPDVDVWLLSILAEMANRRGDLAAQGRYLERARSIAPLDLKLKGHYADWLLSEGRADDVLALLREDEQHDSLLLRLALAARQRSVTALANDYARKFRERQAFASGEARHLREHARFLLDVDDDGAAAVIAARANWQLQREPEDVRLLLRAAHRSGDDGALAIANEWIASTGYEDRMLQ
jgi:tetratricopeptide (TPR) repeat protein